MLVWGAHELRTCVGVSYNQLSLLVLGLLPQLRLIIDQLGLLLALRILFKQSFWQRIRTTILFHTTSIVIGQMSLVRAQQLRLRRIFKFWNQVWALELKERDEINRFHTNR